MPESPKKPAEQERQIYHGFGGRLYHEVPNWVRSDAIYHIRIRCEPGTASLIKPSLASVVLESAQFYHLRHRWWVHLFLLMPDHLHALLSFDPRIRMGKVIGDWKAFHAKKNGIVWQANFFDHRLRNHLEELDAKHVYIRHNPVVRGLCAKAEDWPWQWYPEDSPPDTRPAG